MSSGSPRPSVSQRPDAGAADRESEMRTRLAWCVWAVACLAYIGDVILLVATRDFSPEEASVLVAAAEDFAFVLVATLALVILRSQPANGVGWWLMVAGLSFPLEGLFVGLTAYGVHHWGDVPLVLMFGWVTRWIWLLAAINIPFMLLVYPDGRLPSARWRPVAWSMWAVVVVVFMIDAFDPQPMEEFADLANPFALPGLSSLLDSLSIVVLPLFSLFPLAGALALVSRYRSSGVFVRQQVKLLGWVAVVSVVFFGFIVFQDLGATVTAALNIAYTVFIASVITAGIVRYRLFDIDRLISRTASYAVVIVVLVGVYTVGVTTLSGFLPAESPVAVAAATLAVAALFNPLRKRVQGWVDRRFNRSRYDAQRVMDGFVGSLREGIDGEGLVDGWVGVVADTMQPASLAVWVREGGSR